MSGAKPSFLRPRIECLEDRYNPAVITVTTVADTVAVDGVVSLREAIQSINAGANINADVTASGYGSFTDQIRFTGLSGTIVLTSDLDAVSKSVAISGNTGAGFTGKPVITVDGAGKSSTFTITGPNVIIANLAIVRSRNAGILITGSGATNAAIRGNYIGIDATGTTAAGNRSIGVRIDSGASGALVGGVLGQDSNVISGNSGSSATNEGIGVFIDGSPTKAGPLTTNNIVVGNLIGTDWTGTLAVPNRNGVEISGFGTTGNRIGGTDPSERNIISGNTSAGVNIDGVDGNLVQGNYIGTASDGMLPLPNALGVFISGSNNIVGGTVDGAGNLIAFNRGQGVFIAPSPDAASNVVPLGNQVVRNRIGQNGALGIELTGRGATVSAITSRGVTANDGFDADVGANGLQNYPVITSVVGNQVFGLMTAKPNTTYRVEFFSNTTRDPSGFGEGETFLGFLNVTTDFSGKELFTFTAPSNLTTLYVTSTATGPEGTSEFGNAVLGIPTPTPNAIPLQIPPLVPPINPQPIPQPVPVLNTPLTPPSGTPILRPTPGGPTVTSGIPNVVAGQLSPTIGAQAALAAKAVLAASQGPGGNGVVRVYNTDGTLRVESAIFPGFSGGVRIGTADVDGDGVFDGIAVAGIGGAPHVKVFNGIDGSLLQSFYAYDTSFTGGLFVTGGDLNGDGYAEIITGTAAGGASNVKVFDGLTGVELTSFYAFDPSFTGGVTVAAADMNNDGLVDLVVGAGAGGAPHVKVIEGTSLLQVESNGTISDTALLASYFAYSATFTGGVFVSVGADLNGDGFPDVVTGAGAGGSPHVKIIDTGRMGSVGSDGTISGDALLGSFLGYEETFAGGVRVGEADSNQNGTNEILLGAGPGGGPRVRVFQASDLAVLEDFYAFDPNFTGGIFID